MFKVVYICSSLKRTGPINVLFNLVTNFRPGEISPVIVTLSPEEEDSRFHDFANLGIQIICQNLSHGNLTVFKYRKLYRTLKSLRPDICHPFGFRADMMCSKSLVRNQFHVVSSIYNYPYDDYPMLYGKWKGRLMAYLHIRALSKYNKVITCSDFIVNKLKRHGLNNVYKVYTGVDENFYSPLENKEYVIKRDDLHIPEDAIVFIFIGYLIKRKDPLTLVEAFKDFSLKHNKKVHLLMMGDGELMQACKSVCNGEQITYLGNCSDIRPYLNISDYYISPSLSEGFPTAVLEALSMGLGCILSDIPPHIEMLNNFENAIFFQKQNITDLKEKLESAFGVYQENLKKEARIYFIQNLSAKKMCERHFMVYQNILQ